MAGKIDQIERIFSYCKISNYVFNVGSYIFVSRYFTDLVCFISPSLRKRGREIRLDYDIGLTTLIDFDKGIDSLKILIQEKKFIMLPRVIPSNHSRDMMICDGKPSNWLLNDIDQIFNKYCLERNAANALIFEKDDKLIDDMRELYGIQFLDIIENPLKL